jgi:uncharacterized protein (TIGR02466 family)
MEHQLINIFPLSIYRSKIDLPKDIKHVMLSEIKQMYENTIKRGIISEDSSWTGDTHGHEYLYENPKFDFFFHEVEKHIKKYIGLFELDLNQLDFYFQRAWATVSRGKQGINAHAHKQSHLSFAFYLKKEESDSSIYFVDTNGHNEFLQGLFSSPSISKRGLFKKRDITNSSSININTNEDEIIIFPSKTMHGTFKNVQNNERISISADISLTAKDSSDLEQLMTPVSKWKKFE